MTLDGMLHESLPPRSQASAAEAALPTVLDHLTDVLLSNNFSSKDSSPTKSGNKSNNTTPKKRRSRCVWTENPDKPRIPKSGSRRHQRFMNVKFLLDLGFPEDDLDWSYVTPTKSHFKEMFEDPQLAKQWNEFTKAPEDEQRTALKSKPSSWYRRRSESDFKTICRETDAADVTPEKCFNRLDRRLRTLYRKCHIPGGAVETLEREMLAAFTDRPDHVIVWKMDNGFFRGLLHGICQYHNLRSCSEDMDGERRTIVTNPSPTFKPSPVPLYEFIGSLASRPRRCWDE